jgi:uncharacterized protein
VVAAPADRPVCRSAGCDLPSSVTPAAETLAYARTAPRGEVKRYDASHFEFYLGEPFDAVVADQVEFLTRHLLNN